MLVRVRKDDRVRMLSGKYRGRAATVAADPNLHGIVALRVDGVNGVLILKHMRNVMALPVRTSANAQVLNNLTGEHDA